VDSALNQKKFEASLSNILARYPGDDAGRFAGLFLFC
jgi:hypothetical protein